MLLYIDSLDIVVSSKKFWIDIVQKCTEKKDNIFLNWMWWNTKAFEVNCKCLYTTNVKI